MAKRKYLSANEVNTLTERLQNASKEERGNLIRPSSDNALIEPHNPIKETNMKTTKPVTPVSSAILLGLILLSAFIIISIGPLDDYEAWPAAVLMLIICVTYARFHFLRRKKLSSTADHGKEQPS